MTDCCTNTASELEQLMQRQRSTLKAVLAVNAIMFVVEIAAGVLAGSTALLADSLDMLGDALVYGFSLYVVARSDAWKATSALAKGGIMAAFGLFVLGQAVYKLLHPGVPGFETIGAVAMLALTANSVCLVLLWRHRSEDVNMRSVWLCSRNDIIANTSTLLAAAGVWFTNSQWPDLVIGLAIAALFLRTALHVARDAIAAYAAQGRESSPASGTLRSSRR